MPRAKKEHFERVGALGQYRKRIKDADGKYFALYATTERELADKVCAARGEVEERLVARENPTVGEYADRWLELYTAEMPDSTANTYKNAVKVHIGPQIGGMKLKDVTQDDAKRVLVAMLALSATMQKKTLNTMRKIFDAAIENNLMAKNPCAKLKAGGKKTEEKQPLNREQARTLLDAVRGTRAEPFIMLGLYAGLRREEILGLEWDCVHLDGNAPHIAVKRALRWKKCRPEVTEELKSTAARRDIPIPPQLVAYLAAIKGGKDEFVIGGTPLSQQQYRNLWRIVERREVGETTYRGNDGKRVAFTREKGEKSTSAGFCYTIDFYVTPHILRHTYITNLFLAGVDLKTVQYLAGHSDPKVTLNIYIHLTENRPADLIDQINRAFEVKSEVKCEDMGP